MHPQVLTAGGDEQCMAGVEVHVVKRGVCSMEEVHCVVRAEGAPNFFCFLELLCV